MPDLDTIEVSDIKQWRYCPRVVWYAYCLPAIRPKTDLMRQGRPATGRKKIAKNGGHCAPTA